MLKYSVIIVSFNGLQETTKPCLESIFAGSSGSDYEVIVVDNASSDETCAYLMATAHAQPLLRFIGNRANLGYAAANNIGMKAAQGECLILLNSDTVVTRDSLAALADFVRQNPAVGLTGPVTNSAGNEQMIFTDAPTVAGIIAQGLEWTKASKGDRFESKRLGFFCVAMRRNHLDQVGGLDESFGLGFYEDDDYCLRSLKAGFRLVCLEDVFVYHRGSQSFGRQPPNALKTLIRRNKRLFKRKHGLLFHRPKKWKSQLTLANYYLAHFVSGPAEHLSQRVQNRLNMALSSKPKNAFGNILFYTGCFLTRRKLERILSTAQKPNRLTANPKEPK